MQATIYANLLTISACQKRMPAVPASNGEIRFTLHEIRTTNYYVRNYKKNMQNEPKFQKSQMNVSPDITKEYEKKDTWWSGKNKPNSNPIQSQF